MGLLIDIGQGAGLAGATGVRPFLAPLATGVLAGSDLGIDFDGTGYAFLESPGFLAAVFALAVLTYAAERAGRVPTVALAVLAGVLGGLLFAGALDAEGRAAWPGLVAGVLIAAVGFLAAEGVLGGARDRLEGAQPTLLGLYADLTAVAAVALAVLVPVAGYLLPVALVVLFLRRRDAGERKYEGLRVLR